jgi:ATP-binding cassette subfamily C protein CydD
MQEAMQLPKPKASKSTLRWLKGQSRPASPWIGMALAAGLTSGVLLVAQAHLLARLVQDAFMATGPRTALWPAVVLLFGLVVARSGLVWCRQQAGFRAGAAVRGTVRNAILAHLVASGPVAISPIPAGSLVSAALDQVEALHDFVAHYLPQLALAALLPLVILAFVFPISWAVGGILLFTAPLIPLFMALVGMGAESISQRHFQALARMSAHFLDVLRGLTTLKLFGRSKVQADKIGEISSQYRKRTMAVLRVAFLSSAVLEFFSAIAIALVAIYLGMAYLGYLEFGAYGKPISFAAGFFILLLAPDFFMPLRELGTHYHSRADAVGAAEEILKVLGSIELPKAEGAAEDVESPQNLRFETVSLHYPNTGRPALTGLDLTITRGERIAVVGESGAGKSSLIHLILGFVSPTKGRILIDRKPLDHLTALGLRRHCAWVGQTPMLFSGTIRENIAIANPEADDVLIGTAAALSGVTQFTNDRPGGLDSKIGEQGHGLSAGQAQRVALARAYVRQAPLLLLDEPTARLDKGTEAEIVTDLRAWPTNCTMIIATHRAAALSLADRIIVLQNGQLVAQGTVDQLKASHGGLLPMD